MARPAVQSLTIETMVINRFTGVDGARKARGLVVVIDVLRAFTVSAYALAGGARECLLVSTTAEARVLHDQVPGPLICAEGEALPVAGLPIRDSTTQSQRAARKAHLPSHASPPGPS